MDPNRPSRSSTSSTLGWLGCGCGALVMVVMACIVGMTWFGYRKGKEIERTFKDPAARMAATREILRWRELPEGYYPAGAVSIPMLMDMAILSDEEPRPGRAGHGRAFRHRGLIFMSFNSWFSNERELLRWMRGETKEAPRWIRRSDAKIDPKRVLKRGTVEVDGQSILYVVSRGDAMTGVPEPPEPPAPPRPPGDGKAAPAEREPAPETTDLGDRTAEAEPETPETPRRESLMTFFSFDCPGDNRARMGVWFAPDPAPGKPNAEVDLTGTIGDPETIREFVAHFAPCG
ncbi:MAG TPA: hypothetical protein VEW48_16010 [Thermoanaerobaculia bacterium]|nr:hypothetical protein [Thermoanaerobaculia bacterium]